MSFCCCRTVRARPPFTRRLAPGAWTASVPWWPTGPTSSKCLRASVPQRRGRGAVLTGGGPPPASPVPGQPRVVGPLARCRLWCGLAAGGGAASRRPRLVAATAWDEGESSELSRSEPGAVDSANELCHHGHVVRLPLASVRSTVRPCIGSERLVGRLWPSPGRELASLSCDFLIS